MRASFSLLFLKKSALNSNSCVALQTMAAVLESGGGLVFYLWGIANSCLPSLYLTLDALLTEVLLLDSCFLVVRLSASEDMSQFQSCVSQLAFTRVIFRLLYAS